MASRPKRNSATKDFWTVDVDCIDDESSAVAGAKFDILEIIGSGRFTEGFVRPMQSKDFTKEYAEKSGLREPLVFQENEHLGLVVPRPFTVDDVKAHVGASRIIDVLDVSTQEALQMTMADWTKYYNNKKNRKAKMNVISLEFSHSLLDEKVSAPTLVREIDWVGNVWPSHLREQQQVATNDLALMTYPKVQKYCLMSVGGCYTDFHVDFGGTSVWYHILNGAKVFFLIPPTEANLKKFESWSKYRQETSFFGDECGDDCKIIHLAAGATFFIPTGWIHAVYTPIDSLVFGGNFLHNYNIAGQFAISALESRLRVPERYRFPFFETISWYAASKLVEEIKSTGLENLSPYVKESANALLRQLLMWDVSPKHKASIPAGYQGSSRVFLQGFSLLLHPPLAAKVPSRLGKPLPSQDDESSELISPAAKKQPNFKEMLMSGELTLAGRPAAVQRTPNRSLPSRMTLGSLQQWNASEINRVQRSPQETKKSGLPSKPLLQIKEPVLTPMQRLNLRLNSVSSSDSSVPPSRLGTSLQTRSVGPTRTASTSSTSHKDALDLLYSLPGLSSKPSSTSAQSKHTQTATKKPHSSFPESDPKRQKTHGNNLRSILKPPGSSERVLDDDARLVRFLQESHHDLRSEFDGDFNKSRSAPSSSSSAHSYSNDDSYNESQDYSSSYDSADRYANGDGFYVAPSSKEELLPSYSEAGWLALPKNIWVYILSFLSQNDLRVVRKVCRKLHIYSTCPALWEYVDASAICLTPCILDSLTYLSPIVLDLSWTHISDHELRGLLQYMPLLDTLVLAGCSSLSNIDLALSTCETELRALNLNFLSSNCVDDSLPTILFKYRNSLHTLSVARSNITNNGVYEIAIAFPHLVALDLYQCPSLTMDAAPYFQLCLNLTHLDVRETLLAGRI